MMVLVMAMFPNKGRLSNKRIIKRRFLTKAMTKLMSILMKAILHLKLLLRSLTNMTFLMFLAAWPTH